MSGGFVYFIKPIGLPGPIKIGYSGLPQARLEALMTWSPIHLEVIASVPGTIGLEQNLHKCFAHSHSHGEWFFPTRKVVDFVAAIVAGAPVEEAVDLEHHEGSIRSRYTKGIRKRPEFGWVIRCRHAERKAQRLHQERYFPSNAAKAELKMIAASGNGVPLPEGFDPVALRAYIADPSAHGVSYTQRFGSRAAWLPPLEAAVAEAAS